MDRNEETGEDEVDSAEAEFDEQRSVVVGEPVNDLEPVAQDVAEGFQDDEVEESDETRDEVEAEVQANEDQPTLGRLEIEAVEVARRADRYD